MEDDCEIKEAPKNENIDVQNNNNENTLQNQDCNLKLYFSAKPKVMNLDNIYAPKEGSSFIPAPLSLKRNGFGSELNYERDDGILG